MQFNKAILAASVVAAIGASAVVPEAAFAGPVSAGMYTLVVNTTPFYSSAKGTISFAFGSDGAWASSFAFGGTAPGVTSQAMTQAMTDNGVSLTDADGAGTFSRAFGSGVGGDGFAGKLGITISGTGALSVTSFSKDTITGTPIGNFAQEGGTLSSYSGTVGLATGSFSLTTGVSGPTVSGRRGSIDEGSAGMPCGGTAPANLDTHCDNTWNNDDVGGGSATGYSTFTTGSAFSDSTTINGAVLTSIGDVNSDGLTDYKGVLVSGGDFGAQWGALAGSDYFEVWSVKLLSVVPVPAAVWLFGSGLLGLVGIARRRKTQ